MDGAVANGTNYIIRDDEGGVMAAMAKHIDQLWSPLGTKLLPVREAISFCGDTGFGIIDMDCKQVVELLLEDTNVLSTAVLSSRPY